MPNITLPDGSVKQFDAATTGAEIAASIGQSLARDAVAVKVDGEMYDLTRDIDSDVTVEVVTRNSDDGLELLRHDAAHVLARRRQDHLDRAIAGFIKVGKALGLID